MIRLVVFLLCFTFVYGKMVEVDNVGVVNLITYTPQKLFPSPHIQAMYYHEDDFKLIVKIDGRYIMLCNVLVGTVFNWSTTPKLWNYYHEHIEGRFTCNGVSALAK